MLVPFGYFLWKSLTLRIGDTWPMFLWPAGFAAPPSTSTMLPRENWPAWMVRSTTIWADTAVVIGHRLRRRWCFSITSSAPWNLIGSTDPIGGEAGYQQVVDRAEAELQKTGATWIATTDYRTYAMMRWYFNGRVPVIQINERGRFMGFRDPGMDAIRGHAGIYVARLPDDGQPVVGLTTAVREPLERIDACLARQW